MSTDLLFSVNGVIDFNRQPTKWEVRKHSEQTQFRFIEPVISFWYTFYGLVPDIDIPTYDLRPPPGELMSSPMKDARWQLATVLAEKSDRDFNALDYYLREGYLALAQAELALHPERVQILADRWNTEEPRTDETNTAYTVRVVQAQGVRDYLAWSKIVGLSERTAESFIANSERPLGEVSRLDSYL